MKRVGHGYDTTFKSLKEHTKLFNQLKNNRVVQKDLEILIFNYLLYEKKSLLWYIIYVGIVLLTTLFIVLLDPTIPYNILILFLLIIIGGGIIEGLLVRRYILFPSDLSWLSSNKALREKITKKIKKISFYSILFQRIESPPIILENFGKKVVKKSYVQKPLTK